MTKIILLAIAVVSMGCMKQQPQTYEQKVEALSQASNLHDMVEAEDSEWSEKFKELEESEDPALDRENNKDVENPTNKVLVAGDSWASFACRHGSMKKALKKAKSKISADDRCGRASKLGIEASKWIGSKQDLRIKEYLQTNKNIKFIILSLGGNDLMDKWHKDYTPEQEYELSLQVFNQIKAAARGYIALRPDIKVIISGYDYPHFKEDTIIWFYKRTYKKMGKPSHQQINEALIRFNNFMANIVDGKNIYYINHLGLAQYYDGAKDQFAPLMTAAPDQISPLSNPAAIGGDPRFPTSQKSMLDWLWLFRDSFHLNEKNYDRLMQHTYDNVLVKIAS